jgi:thiamine biosynthesis lipoprotein
LKQLYRIEHKAMATVNTLYLYADSPASAEVCADQVFQEIDRIEDLLSAFRPHSELSRINREAASGPVTTDPETFRFLEAALLWSDRSSGAFDITVGALMKTWGFHQGSGSIAAPEELRAAGVKVGWQKVQLDPTNRTVRFLTDGLQLDPGGIGKGYAVDRAISKLRAMNVAAALLSAGSSSIYALGAPPGESGWKVRVPQAHRKQDVLSTVILRDTSLSTASLYGKHFTHNGQSYGSIMDPRTGQPVRGTLQVTIIAFSAMTSDALSNAVFTLDSEGRQRLLAQTEEVSALVVCQDGHSVLVEPTRWPNEIAAIEEVYA